MPAWLELGFFLACVWGTQANTPPSPGPAASQPPGLPTSGWRVAFSTFFSFKPAPFLQSSCQTSLGILKRGPIAGGGNPTNSNIHCIHFSHSNTSIHASICIHSHIHLHSATEGLLCGMWVLVTQWPWLAEAQRSGCKRGIVHEWMLIREWMLVLKQGRPRGEETCG